MALPQGKVALIVNPTSGGGRGARVLELALPHFEARGITPEVHVTASGSEPPGVARLAADDGAALVVAVGGDGHVAAVGQGLAGTGGVMAVLPAGSANDYARTIRMPINDVRSAVDALIDGESQRVDAIRVAVDGDQRIFMNVVGTGFDAEVAEAAERITIMRGSGRYVLAIMRVLPRFKAAALDLTVDGRRTSLRAMMIAIAKGPAYGGGMRVAPGASLTSGELEICVVGEIGKVGFLRAFPRVFRGTHVTHPRVTMMRGREISIDADRPLHLMGDGERLGRLPATISVLPKAVSLVFGPAVANRSSE
jgi:diacylglycerol kinase (ATP)